MGISEILIIYLAIGAPIGVYAIIRPKNSFKQNLVGLLAANVFLWPVFASLQFLPVSAASREPNHFVDGRLNPTTREEKTRVEFSSSVRLLGDRTFRRVAVESFDRVAALSHALDRESLEPEISVPEIFEVAGHPNPPVAAKCLFRKNHAKLTDHHRRAIEDLRSLGEDLASQDRTNFQKAADDLS